MKKLKFDPALIPAIKSGTVTTTWRLYDDKQLSVGDTVQLADSQTGDTFGNGTITETAEKLLSQLSDNDKIGHEDYATDDDMMTTLKSYYGPNVSGDSVVKVVHFRYDPPAQQGEKHPHYDELIAHTDGGSRGNPGPSASGFVLHDLDGNLVAAGGEYLGITTNNQAEYQAVLLAMQHAKQFGCKKLRMQMDSMLVANQMNGIFKIRNRDLWPIHDSIKRLAKEFEKVTYEHVYREQNKLADAEVNKMLDSTGH